MFCIRERGRSREGERKREREEDLRSKHRRQNILRPHLFIFLPSSPPYLHPFPPPFPLLLSLAPVFSSARTPQFHSLRKLSQDPVQTPIPSSGTPVQLTLLSWPESTPGGGEEERRKKRNERKEKERQYATERKNYKMFIYFF